MAQPLLPSLLYPLCGILPLSTNWKMYLSDSENEKLEGAVVWKGKGGG